MDTGLQRQLRQQTAEALRSVTAVNQDATPLLLNYQQGILADGAIANFGGWNAMVGTIAGYSPTQEQLLSVYEAGIQSRSNPAQFVARPTADRKAVVRAVPYSQLHGPPLSRGGSEGHVKQIVTHQNLLLELPEAYDTPVGERGAALSGGQRQRIAIARAPMSNPRILIFDEATSALDYESERIIRGNLGRICKGRTVFIVAHRLSTIRQADTILVLDEGQLVEQGSHNELMARPGIYHHLFSRQLGGVSHAVA